MRPVRVTLHKRAQIQIQIQNHINTLYQISCTREKNPIGNTILGNLLQNWLSGTVDCLCSLINTLLFRRKKKICVFPVTRPTLIFCCDPKVFIAFEDKMP